MCDIILVTQPLTSLVRPIKAPSQPFQRCRPTHEHDVILLLVLQEDDGGRTVKVEVSLLVLRLPPGVPQPTPQTSHGTARSAAAAEAASSASCKLLINHDFVCWSFVLRCIYLCHHDMEEHFDYLLLCVLPSFAGIDKLDGSIDVVIGASTAVTKTCPCITSLSRSAPHPSS